VTLSPDYRDTLELFCRRARELADCSVFRDGKHHISLTISVKVGEETRFSETAPEKEALIALVTVLRQFYAPGESINFGRVCDIVWKSLPPEDAEARQFMAAARELFNKVKTQSGPNIMVHGERLPPIRIVDLWFNGSVFHAEPDKVKQLDELSRSPIAPIIAFIFRSTVVNLAAIVIQFSRFVENKFSLTPP